MNKSKANKLMMSLLLAGSVVSTVPACPVFAQYSGDITEKNNEQTTTDRSTDLETETTDEIVTTPETEEAEETTGTEPAEDQMQEEETPAEDELPAQDAVLEQEEQPETNDVEGKAAEEDEQTEGAVVMNGKTCQTVQDAVDAAENGALIDINGDQSAQVIIPAGKSVTINVAAGVVWTNADTKEHWEGSVINNKGTLILNSQGTIKAAKNKSQTFAVNNAQGGVITMNGGTYTSEHGDYIVMNTGTMTVTGNALIDKPVAGSQTALLNGYRYGPRANDQPAHLTIVSATINAPYGIALKNDDYGFATIEGGNFSAGVAVVQNLNNLTINGGNFTVSNPDRGYAIHNTYVNNTFSQGIVTINNANFSAAPGANMTEIFHAGNSTLAKQNTHIYGGTYFADQAGVCDVTVEPRKLHEHDGRFYVEIPADKTELNGTDSIEEEKETTITAVITPR